jgi:hypothetical protein
LAVRTDDKYNTDKKSYRIPYDYYFHSASLKHATK